MPAVWDNEQLMKAELTLSATPGHARARVPRELRRAGYGILLRPGHPGDGLLTSATVNEALRRGWDAPLLISDDEFTAVLPPGVRRALLRRFTGQKDTVLFNGAKVRLASDPVPGGDGRLDPVAIQRTRYFETLVTNEAASLAVTAGDGRTVFSGPGLCFPGGVVPPCRDSRCANHYGAVTLALTSDGYFVITGQGSANAIHPGLWTASGSGSADWDDTRGAAGLQDLVLATAVRELTEETGLARADVESIRLIGYGRALARGGIPQFYLLARLRRGHGETRITRSERDLVAFHTALYLGRQPPFRPAMAAVREELLTRGDQVSSSLWWCADLLSRLTEEDLAGLCGAGSCGPEISPG
jgi:8-oxo-dGTP pyrophosphatase MutT (NUDIX family)